LPHINATLDQYRRTAQQDNKKEDVLVQEGIDAFISDSGTTADHQQTYLILMNVGDLTADINPDTDSFYDGLSTYKVANSAKKTYHYQLRAVKKI